MKKNLLIGIISSLALIAPVVSCSNTGNNVEKNYGEEYVTSVSLNFEFYNFENIGDQAVFEATYTVKDGKEYKGGVEWKSSQPKVAVVDNNGTVTAIGGGECYITAIVGYKAASCKVTVPHPDEPAGDLTFSISSTSISLKPNTNYQLYCYMNGNDVTSTAGWVSNNEAVATVSQGVVTGVSEGEAIITTTYENKVCTCTARVTSEAVVEFTITLDRSSVTLIPNASTQLNAITSEEAEVSWSTSDDSVATVNNGLVTAKKEGTAVITATAKGKSATCRVTVEEEDDEDKCVLVRFFLDYNNVDPNDTTGKKKLAEFMWYQNVPLKGADELPSNPTTSQAADPAFPYFIGWSTHTLIDTKDDLWNIDTDCVDGTVYTLTLYGIWSDVEVFNL